MKNVDTSALVRTLKKNKVIVEFTKVDGSKRKMLCTQSTDLIAAKKLPASTKTVRGVITVYDLEKKDWRSMRKDSVKKWTVAA